MKISPPSLPLLYPPFKTQTHSEKEGGSGSQQEPPPRKKKEPSLDEKVAHEDFSVSLEKLTDAVEQFSKDIQTQQNGLQALIEGEGENIKVTLKDSKGKAVRQLSGKEFIQIRAQVLPSGLTRGKILDQKL